ncbi:phosphoglycolate phosphatase [Sphaerotilus hippei]|uniref:Phosphoglycolate phosphatase n=1 Tax=Sphaerotilus hippei TaxID=744406 RepID=A0A318H1P5_9BURK|nr:HAD-IA family hydrolase [Sphaerotilus hippei]PXW97024.1 phosphoglycolate phosphatase [Sphaerotilus hippei]
MSHSAPRPRRYDLVVFDWDGTLFDSTALIVRSIQAACRDLGVPEPDDERASYVIGLGLHDALAHAVPGLPEAMYPELGRRYRQHYFRDQQHVTLFDGVEVMLEALRARNHWLGVATGKSRQGLDEALRLSGLRPMFDSTRTADETASKPDPRMLQELMREFGVEPDRTLMIGDTTHDLLLASNAGAHGVAVSYGAHELARLADHQPLYTAGNVAELHAWLQQNA